jgi:hypothetical protein
MKRLNVKPEGEIPTAYKDLIEVSLDKEVSLEKETVKPVLLSQISSKTLSGYNLKKIPVLKVMLRNSKLVTQEKLFEEDVQTSFLNFLEPGENQLDERILLAVLQMSEDYFVYGSEQERTEFKTLSISRMVQKYYRDDPEVLNLGIRAIWSQVKKSTKFSRFRKRQLIKIKKICVFFSKILK